MPTSAVKPSLLEGLSRRWHCLSSEIVLPALVCQPPRVVPVSFHCAFSQ